MFEFEFYPIDRGGESDKYLMRAYRRINECFAGAGKVLMMRGIDLYLKLKY